MRRSLLAQAFATLALMPALMSSPLPAAQEPQRFETTVQRSVSIPFLLFLPQGYQPTGENRWPLLLFLHGAGERGTDLDLVARHGPPKLVKDRPGFPFVVVSPQCPEGATWEPEALDALLDHLLSRHAVDPKRVYLTGLSMGGYGTWAWAALRPQRFAAIAPICGGGEPIRIWLASGARRDALARLPIWAFHGAKDPVVPLAESERMIDAYKRLGNTPKLTVYPEAGHDAWTETYANPAFFDWLLQQQLP